MELNDKEESQATRDHTRINNLSLISLSRFFEARSPLQIHRGGIEI